MGLLIEFVYLPGVFCSVPITPCNTPPTAEGGFLPFIFLWPALFLLLYRWDSALFCSRGLSAGPMVSTWRLGGLGRVFFVWTISMYDNQYNRAQGLSVR